MRFVRDEWVPGSHAAFEKFDAYVPRDEPASWIAGGKRMLFDRIDWQILPDPATAAAALQNGEVDWWETPLPDLVPLLKRSGKINVDIADPLGNIGSFRMNHLYPPFNDVRARTAMLMALDQAEYMTAVTGGDETLMRSLPELLHAGHRAVHRSRRRAAEGAAQIRRGEEAAGGERLQGRARGPAGCN